MSEEIQVAGSNKKTAEFGDYRDFIPELRELEEIVDESVEEEAVDNKDSEPTEVSSNEETEPTSEEPHGEVQPFFGAVLLFSYLNG